MQDACVFDLQDQYRAMVTDNPTVYTSLKVGSKAKRIMNYVAVQPKLKELEKRIDKVAGTRKYVYGPDKNDKKDDLVAAIESGDTGAVARLPKPGATAPPTGAPPRARCEA